MEDGIDGVDGVDGVDDAGVGIGLRAVGDARVTVGGATTDES
ncbi:MAG TPA: hypothetical protein VII33_20545 [Nakamurella sp.]